jgi:hypothetical protein
MKTRLALLLSCVLVAASASVAAQGDATPSPVDIDRQLIDQLCGAAAADESELAHCVGSVEAALVQLREAAAEQDQSLLDQAQAIVDDAVEGLREIDIEATLDELVASAQDFELEIDIDVQGAIDDAVAAFEGIELPTDFDVQAAFDQAVAEALAATEDFDLQAAVDAALADAQAAIDEADLQGTVDEAVAAIEEGVEEARAVVAEAQRWAQENRVAVCRGGSISLGTTVGIAVFALTGIEWLGLQAFWATERLTNGICGDVVG